MRPWFPNPPPPPTSRCDILINNAGLLRDVSFAKMSHGQWDLVLKTHLEGTYRVTKAAWPYMREQAYGRVVNITSVNGLYGQVGPGRSGAAGARGR